ncbi:MAG: aminotransferase, partial [Muribaculaceae bacterium]|nr:aminotransferase [Muribaculaceae bacterium]
MNKEFSGDGIVIQARSGSTRMPAKILLPFSGEKRIIDIVIENIKRECPDKRIVLATTVNPADDVLEEVARQHNIAFFRGSEENVLSRFVGAAEKFGLKRLIRVCSDNPFLDASSFGRMFEVQSETGADYVCFSFPDGRPTIKSHLGLFAELATTDALRKASSLTDEKLYLEHVTIYLYTHPDIFSIARIPLPPFLGGLLHIA